MNLTFFTCYWIIEYKDWINLEFELSKFFFLQSSNTLSFTHSEILFKYDSMLLDFEFFTLYLKITL